MAEHIVVLTTVGSKEDAIRIARALVEHRLAACVNITSPIHSVFRWKGEVEESQEHLLLIKSVRDNFERLKSTLASLHAYELPEIIAFPIELGEETYLNWVAANAEEPPTEF